MGKINRGRVPSRKMGAGPVEACGALILSRVTGRYLFLLRPEEKKQGPSWGLAGGRKEAGETIAQCLVREVREETTYDISQHKLIPIEQFTANDGGFIYHTFVVIVEHEFCPTLNDEHLGYAWCPIASHPSPLHPGVWRSFSFGVITDKLRTLQDVIRDQLQDKID